MIYEISGRDGQKFTTYEEVWLVNGSFCTFQVEWKSWKKARETMKPRELVTWMVNAEPGQRSLSQEFEKEYGKPSKRQRVTMISSGSPREVLRPPPGWKVSAICDSSLPTPEQQEPMMKNIVLVMMFPSRRTIEELLGRAMANEVMST